MGLVKKKEQAPKEHPVGTKLITVAYVNKFTIKTIDDEIYGTSRPLKPENFEPNVTYEVEVQKWERNGKEGYNIIEAKKADESKPEVKKAVAEIKQKTDSREEGMKLGNRKNVAATLIQGLTIANQYSKEDALKAYFEIYDALTKDDESRQ